MLILRGEGGGGGGGGGGAGELNRGGWDDSSAMDNPQEVAPSHCCSLHVT